MMYLLLPISVEAMNEKDMYNILKEALYEFPVLRSKSKYARVDSNIKS